MNSTRRWLIKDHKLDNGKSENGKSTTYYSIISLVFSENVNYLEYENNTVEILGVDFKFCKHFSDFMKILRTLAERL